MVTLYNVVDIRTNTLYSVAIVPEMNRKYFKELGENINEN